MAHTAGSSNSHLVARLHDTVQSLLCSCLDRLVGVTVDPGQSLVINGFWRSGTTWVQEIAAEMMNAKMVFEPFQARAKAIFGCLDELRPARRDYPFVNALMPYLESCPQDGKLRELIEGSLRGQLRSHHVRRGRPQLRDSLRDRVAVKFTRGSLCLTAISQCFQTPVLHVQRDPRAVIASIKKGYRSGWGEGAFDDFDLATHLLGVDDGRRRYFVRWEREIVELQRQDDIARLAGYYCLTEQCLDDQLAQANPSRFIRLQYEDLLSAGPEKLRSSLESIGVRTVPVSLERFSRKSSTAYPAGKSRSEPADPGKTATKWKSLLTPAEQTSIEDVVAMFGMENRLYAHGKALIARAVCVISFCSSFLIDNAIDCLAW